MQYEMFLFIKGKSINGGYCKKPLSSNSEKETATMAVGQKMLKLGSNITVLLTNIYAVLACNRERKLKSHNRT